MKLRNLSLAIGSLAGSAAVLLITLAVSLTGPAQAVDPGIDDMSIDMDPSGTPANTGSPGVYPGSVGSIETCARVDENDVLDADEDVTADTLSVEITAKGIGPSDPMIAFGFTLNFPDASVRVVSRNVDLLLGAMEGSEVFNASQPVPDAVSPISISAADTAIGTHESGDGPLARMGIESIPGAVSGVFPLTLTLNGFIGAVSGGGGFSPTTTGNATVAVNEACSASGTETVAPSPPGQTPSPTPTLTPPGQTPSPTSTADTPRTPRTSRSPVANGPGAAEEEDGGTASGTIIAVAALAVAGVLLATAGGFILYRRRSGGP